MTVSMLFEAQALDAHIWCIQRYLHTSDALGACRHSGLN